LNKKAITAAAKSTRQTAGRKSVQDRAPFFSFQEKNGKTLFAEELSLEVLAKRHGTPLYVDSAAALRQRVRDYETAFAGYPHTFCYAVKSNSTLGVLKLLAAEGCGFDVVSGGELQRVIGADPSAVSRTVYSGVGKTAGEIDLAIASGILLFNLESEAEMELVAERSARARKVTRVSFRVNPDVDAKTHPYISTGLKENKFGVPIQEARALYARAASYDFLEPVGVSAHIGSQVLNLSPFPEAVSRLLALVKVLLADGLNIGYLDIGGGLGVPYDANSNASFAALAKRYANSVLRGLKNSDLHLIVEPGRSISATAGLLLTRVLYCKRNGKKQFAVVDGAMTDLIRPALYHAKHTVVPVSPRRNKPEGNAIVGIADVVGPVCESGDFLALDCALPHVAAGDLLAIYDAGAYGITLASNYNTRLRPAEILVDGKKAKVIRRRETMNDLLSLEK
jgi:diaminopimelate decarboxylase